MASQAETLALAAETFMRAALALDRIDERERRAESIERREAAFERSLRSARHEPRRLDFAMMARAVPGLARQFVEPPAKQVPPEFWHLDNDETAVVACPCGTEPHVAIQTLETCECGRVFVFDGDQVRAIPPESRS